MLLSIRNTSAEQELDSELNYCDEQYINSTNIYNPYELLPAYDLILNLNTKDLPLYDEVIFTH